MIVLAKMIHLFVEKYLQFHRYISTGNNMNIYLYVAIFVIDNKDDFKQLLTNHYKRSLILKTQMMKINPESKIF
jgi:hypothetical protein